MEKQVILNSHYSIINNKLSVPLKIIQLGIRAVKNHSARCYQHCVVSSFNRFELQIYLNKNYQLEKKYFAPKHMLIEARRICVILDDTTIPALKLGRDLMVKIHLAKFREHNINYIESFLSFTEVLARCRTPGDRNAVRNAYDLFLVAQESEQYIYHHLAPVTV